MLMERLLIQDLVYLICTINRTYTFMLLFRKGTYPYIMQNNFLIWIPINDPIHGWIHTYKLRTILFLFYVWVFTSH